MGPGQMGTRTRGSGLGLVQGNNCPEPICPRIGLVGVDGVHHSLHAYEYNEDYFDVLFSSLKFVCLDVEALIYSFSY